MNTQTTAFNFILYPLPLLYIIENKPCIRHVGVVGSISRLIHGIAYQGHPHERALMTVGIDVSFIIFVTRLEITKY